MRALRVTVLSAVLFTWIAAPAEADLVTFRFDGSVTAVGAMLMDHIAVGDPFSMMLTWDAAQTSPLQLGTLTIYEHAFHGMTLAFGDLTYTLNRPNSGVSQLNVFDIDGVPDRLFTYGELSPGWFDGPTLGPLGLTPWYVEHSVSFPADTWASQSLPRVLPHVPLAGAGNLYWDAVDSDSPSLRGTLSVSTTNVQRIPEPSTLLLLTAGAMAAAGLRRRFSS